MVNMFVLQKNILRSVLPLLPFFLILGNVAALNYTQCACYAAGECTDMESCCEIGTSGYAGLEFCDSCKSCCDGEVSGVCGEGTLQPECPTECPTTELPDLTIYTIIVNDTELNEDETASVLQDTNANITVGITNIGTEDVTTSFYSSIHDVEIVAETAADETTTGDSLSDESALFSTISPSEVEYTSTLAAGASDTLHFEIAVDWAIGETRYFQAAVDTHSIDESNEENNTFQFSIEAAGEEPAGECTPGEMVQCGPDTNAGICEFGTQTCDVNGTWSACQGAVYSGEEICSNGLDDDCDGEVDEVDCVSADLILEWLKVNGFSILYDGNQDLGFVDTAYYNISVKNASADDITASFKVNLYDGTCAAGNLVKSLDFPALAAGASHENFFGEQINWVDWQNFCIVVDAEGTVAETDEENNTHPFRLRALGPDIIYSYNPFVAYETVIAGIVNPEQKEFSFTANQAPLSVQEITVDDEPSYNIDIFEMFPFTQVTDYTVTASAADFLADYQTTAVDKYATEEMGGFPAPIEYALADEMSVRWWLDPYSLKLMHFKRLNNLTGLFFEVVTEE